MRQDGKRPISNGITGRTAAVAASLVMLGVLYYLPMFRMEGIVASDDTTFHLGRLVGLANVWASPVNFDSFGQNGLMVNIFYPWLTMYPMRLIYEMSGSYVFAYKAYYTLLTVATILISYVSVKLISGRRTGAYVFAVLYTFSSYRYADIFNRGSLGEAIALTFLPLVLLGIYRVCLGDHGKWAVLTAGMTLIAYSHILTLLMSAAFVGMMYLATLAFQDKRKERFLSLVKAACLSAGLSAAMMIPMAEQYIRNDLFTPGGSGEQMARSAYSLKEIILFTLLNNPEGRGAGILGGAAFAGACLLLAVMAAGRAGRGSAEPKIIFSALLMLTGLVLFVCTSDILPWRYIGENTPLATIQFAWRLNAYSVLAFTGAFSILAAEATAEHPRAGAAVIIIAAAAAVSIHGLALYNNTGMRMDKDLIRETDIASWPSGNVDYAPLRAYEFRESAGRSMEYIYIGGEELEKSPETRDRGTEYIQRIDAPRDGTEADIPVFRYHGEKVKLDGTEAPAEMSARGTTLVAVPEGSSVIEISYRYTALARASWLFSIIILLYATISGALKKKTKDREHS